ncbi:hypothetical protein TcCL_NonESM12367, partial [Trypanosoma cruzi]
ACGRLFFQSRTRSHHTPIKTFGPSHAKELSGGTAGKATPAAMSSSHTPTHRCPAYHQKQKYQRNLSHPKYKSQVQLQLTLPPPGRVRPSLLGALSEITKSTNSGTFDHRHSSHAPHFSQRRRLAVAQRTAACTVAE